ncbi:MAG: hypothetical protein Q9217_004065 [Psora testacea]
MPINSKYRDTGTIVEGKIEDGQCKKGSTYVMLPNRQETSISALYGETEDEVLGASCGDQVRMRIRGAEEEDIAPGFVLCSHKRLYHYIQAFEEQIALLELKSILCTSFNCVLHIYSAIEEVTIEWRKAPGGAVNDSLLLASRAYEYYPQMGRFTLRDQAGHSYIGSNGGAKQIPQEPNNCYRK